VYDFEIELAKFVIYYVKTSARQDSYDGTVIFNSECDTNCPLYSQCSSRPPSWIAGVIPYTGPEGG